MRDEVRELLNPKCLKFKQELCGILMGVEMEDCRRRKVDLQFGGDE